MKTNECFECGVTEDLQQHHVVPRSRGGTKTITLCTQCHGKAHGRDLKGLEHSRLTKEGIQRARQRGVKIGNPNISDFIQKGSVARKIKGRETAMKWGPKIEKLRNENKSYRECGEILDLRTTKGTLMDSSGVQKILIRYQKLMEGR